MAYEAEGGPGDEIVLETDAGRRLCRIDDRMGKVFRITSSIGVPEIGIGKPAPRRWRTHRRSGGLHRQPPLRDFCRAALQCSTTWEAVGEKISSPPPILPSPDECGIRAHDRRMMKSRYGFMSAVSVPPPLPVPVRTAGSAAITLRGAAPVLRVIAPGGAANCGMAWSRF